MILPQTETWHQHDPLLPFPLCVPSFVSSDSGSQGVSVFLYLCICICICWRRESLPAVLSFDPGSHGVSGRAALHSVTSELSFRDPSLLLALHINWEHQDMIQGLQLLNIKNPTYFSENKIVSSLSSSPCSALMAHVANLLSLVLAGRKPLTLHCFKNEIKNITQHRQYEKEGKALRSKI